MLALGFLGCTSTLTGVFVGDIPTTPGVLVAMSAGPEQVGVVVAGEGDTLSWSRAFEGPLAEDGTFSLSQDGWTLEGQEVAGGGYALVLTDPDGAGDPEFTLQPPIDPASFDGPFVGAGAGCQTTAVVFNSGGQMQGAACADDGALVPVVEPAAGLTFAEGAITVEADLGAGPEPLILDQLAFHEEE